MLLVTLSYGVLGFMDDYAKVTKQTTAGVSSSMKLIIQFAIAGAATFVLIRFGGRPTGEPAALATSVAFPVFKNLLVNLGWFYVVFGMVTIGGFSNAVNLTDGLDGLAIVPVMIAAAAFGVIAYVVGNYVFAQYLQVHFVLGVGEMAPFCGAMIGSGWAFSGTTPRRPRFSWATRAPWRWGAPSEPWPWRPSTRSCWGSSAVCSWPRLSR